jgi:NAD(P)-dependent dehydrogenase (short-subunit alcohol dehydrogenase family)
MPGPASSASSDVNTARADGDGTRSVVVTGASTGIGRACVNELVRNGFHAWGAVRTDEDEAALRRDHGDAVTVLRLDLTDEASVKAAGDVVRAAGPLHGLVNNAGVALPGPLEYMPSAVFRRQIDVNLVGQLLVTQAMMPALRLARDGDADARVVMVGSIGGRIAGPMLGAYHTSKFGLVGLTDSLRAELAPFGVRVVLIEPGSVATPIWSRGGAAGDDLIKTLPAEVSLYAGQIEAARANASRMARRGLAPERAARLIVKALTARSPRPRYLIGSDARMAALVARLPYRLRYRLTAARS